MELDRAKKILLSWVKADRNFRNNSIKSDFDKFCEERNEAIQTVLTELEVNKK